MGFIQFKPKDTYESCHQTGHKMETGNRSHLKNIPHKWQEMNAQKKNNGNDEYGQCQFILISDGPEECFGK